jgi:hypothetical protein
MFEKVRKQFQAKNSFLRWFLNKRHHVQVAPKIKLSITSRWRQKSNSRRRSQTHKATMELATSFFSLGLTIMCHSTVVAKECNSVARFCSFFGTSPEVKPTCGVPVDLYKTWLLTGVKLVHLLWSLKFLKLYCAKSILATLATRAGKKSVNKKMFQK